MVADLHALEAITGSRDRHSARDRLDDLQTQAELVLEIRERSERLRLRKALRHLLVAVGWLAVSLATVAALITGIAILEGRLAVSQAQFDQFLSSLFSLHAAPYGTAALMLGFLLGTRAERRSKETERSLLKTRDNPEDASWPLPDPEARHPEETRGFDS